MLNIIGEVNGSTPMQQAPDSGPLKTCALTVFPLPLWTRICPSCVVMPFVVGQTWDICQDPPPEE